MTIILADCIDSAVLVVVALVALVLATGIIPVPWREPRHRRMMVIGAAVLVVLALVMPVINAAVRASGAASASAVVTPERAPAR